MRNSEGFSLPLVVGTRCRLERVSLHSMVPGGCKSRPRTRRRSLLKQRMEDTLEGVKMGTERHRVQPTPLTDGSFNHL